MRRLAIDDDRLQSLCHQRPRLDFPARRADDHPATVGNAALAGEFGADLHEHLRLELAQPAVEAAHRPAEVMLGQPVGGRDQRVRGIAGGNDRIHRVRGDDRQGVGLLTDQRVQERRFERLVEHRQGTIFETIGHVQPATAVRVHPERGVSSNRGHPLSSRRGTVARSLRDLEIRHIIAGPPLRHCVPPDELLAL